MGTDIQRAAASAVPSPGLERGGQFLTFVLGGESYAAPIHRVKEIIEHREPTAVPLMPPYIRGVINLRGQVVPVIDLQVRFGRAPSQVYRRSCIVIVESGAGEDAQVLGMLVDAVSAVVDIGVAEIESPPAFGVRLRGDFIRGMGKVGGRFVILLDMARVLSIEELSAVVALGADTAETPDAGA